jgi:protein phosphatase
MTSRLYFGRDMDAPEIWPLAGGTACVLTQRRPGRESANQDAAALIPGAADNGVLAVADGLGGLPAGDQASALALQCLDTRVAGQHADTQREAVLTGLEEANAAILASTQGSATTIAVAAIEGDRVRTYHAGDSMIVVCGQRGKLKYQTVPHSPVGYAEAAGMLDEDGAMFHTERHLVSNVVGTPKMRVEISPLLRLAPRDTVVIASDGLFDNLYVWEIIELVRIGPLDAAAGRLHAGCLDRMLHAVDEHPHKPDDLTFILYRRQ